MQVPILFAVGPFMNCPCFLQFITSSAGNETNCVSQGKMGYIKQQTWGESPSKVVAQNSINHNVVFVLCPCLLVLVA